MRAVIAALAVVFGLAIPASAGAAGTIEQETESLVVHQLLALRTTDGVRLTDAACAPITYHYGVAHGKLFGDFWGCYAIDSLARVYVLHTHVRNTDAGGLDTVNVISCYGKGVYSKFACPPGAKIEPAGQAGSAKARHVVG